VFLTRILSKSARTTRDPLLRAPSEANGRWSCAAVTYEAPRLCVWAGRVVRPVVHRGPHHRRCSSRTRNDSTCVPASECANDAHYAVKGALNLRATMLDAEIAQTVSYDRSLLKRTRIVYRSQSGQRTR
jgi:hypothetical protein